MNSLPECPECSSEYTYEDGSSYVCPECGYEWADESDETSEQANPELVVKDVNGNRLQDGDAVIVIKDLKVKGSSSVVKVGTKVKNIHLTSDGDHNIDCRISGIGEMKLKSQFVKKV